MKAVPFQRVAVLGLGALGGSVARALASQSPGPVVLGWAPDADQVAAALGVGAIHQALATPETCAAEADLVVLAAPMGACVELMKRLAPHLPPDAVVTDVASLKAPLAAAAERWGLQNRWVGGHPLCGTADSGFGASRADLFTGARVWTCAHADAQHHVASVHEFWASVGAEPASTDPVSHDALMAPVSHLPQLTANALAAVLREAGVTPAALGPGGLDMTRLAGSSPDMWRDILTHATSELPGHLRSLSAQLERLAQLVEQGNMEALAMWMSETRSWRQGP